MQTIYLYIFSTFWFHSKFIYDDDDDEIHRKKIINLVVRMHGGQGVGHDVDFISIVATHFN